MPTKTVYVTLVLCTIVLFSCNRKKSIDESIILHPVIEDTVKLKADDVVDITSFIQGFVQNIVQKFEVPPQKISIITAKNGLRVTVDPAVLQKEDGAAIDGKINVSIIELTTSNDLFKSNAATISDNHLLASGGSYFVGMECNGQKVKIKKSHSVQIDLPVLKRIPMELFYGERDSSDNMNWVNAGIKLQQQALVSTASDLQFTENSQAPSDMPAFFMNEKKQPLIFQSLNSQVYFYGQLMTIVRLVDTINRHTKRIFIDTVQMCPKQLTALLPGQYLDKHYLESRYGPEKQFIVKTYKAKKEEADCAEENKIKQKEALEKWQPQTLAGQLQKYYTPTAVRKLGWINCDCFYQNNEQIEMPLEVPITFNKASLQYFVVFRSFNGLLSGRIGGDDKKVLDKLPVNERVTIIVFTKYNGEVFQAKQDLVIQKGQTIKLDMKNISAEEMNKIFGKNVKI